jgi:hypothetical protein
MRWPFALCLVFMTACGMCKGDPDKCDKMCRNYAELDFWDKANVEIDKLPIAERDAARKQKMAEFARNLEKGIDFCISKCVSANNTEDTDCVIAAKTAKAARDCVTK